MRKRNPDSRDPFMHGSTLPDGAARSTTSHDAVLKKNGFQCFYLENDYTYEAYLGLSGQKESELGRLRPFGDKGERPRTADMVFFQR
jgi:hypothetical protein